MVVGVFGSSSSLEASAVSRMSAIVGMFTSTSSPGAISFSSRKPPMMDTNTDFSDFSQKSPSTPSSGLRPVVLPMMVSTAMAVLPV